MDGERMTEGAKIWNAKEFGTRKREKARKPRKKTLASEEQLKVHSGKENFATISKLC